MDNKDFMQYVFNRCDAALTQDVKYIEMQTKYVDAVKEENHELEEELTELMEIRATELCYTQGFRDAMAIMNNNM